ncbi:MAG: hypothetical protein IT434_05525 [Phycisphaerales bacterium]|jgi:hypothetical protein|nr:hypothetical protein [Phycisphaerales bacterium]
MSLKGVIALVVLTIALAIPTWLVTRSPREVATPTKLFANSDLSKSDAIELSHSSGKSMKLACIDAANDRWMLTWREGSQDQSWPASTPRVRAVLRLLSALVTSIPSDLAPTKSSNLSIAIGAAKITATIDESLVSGRAALRLNDISLALIDTGLHSVLTTPDPAVWRDPAAFPSPIAEASRLSISTGGQELSLARVGRQWAIVKPVAEPADRAIVDELLKSLASIQAQRFIPDAGVDWKTPTASIRVELDQRTPSGEEVTRSTLMQELLIGGTADVGGATILARANASIDPGAARAPLWGPAPLVLSRQAIESLTTDPASVISRSPAPGPRADVARITLSPADVLGGKPVEFIRTLSGWTRDRTPVAPADAKSIDDLLALIFDTRADKVRSKPTPGSADLGSISLFRDDASPIATLELSQATQGPDAGFIASRGAFHWTFAPNAASKSAFSWIAAQAEGP